MADRSIEPIRLTAKHGQLYIPNEFIYDAHHGAYYGSDDILLMCSYRASETREWPEHDTIPWPMPAESADGYWNPVRWHSALQLALYDARETGEINWRIRQVILPDGSTFDIE